MIVVLMFHMDKESESHFNSWKQDGRLSGSLLGEAINDAAREMGDLHGAWHFWKTPEAKITKALDATFTVGEQGKIHPTVNELIDKLEHGPWWDKDAGEHFE